MRHQEAGAQLLGDFSRPHDLVESLTIGGLNRNRTARSTTTANAYYDDDYGY